MSDPLQPKWQIALGRSRPISVAMAEHPSTPRWWRGGVLLLLALVLAIAGRPWLKL